MIPNPVKDFDASSETSDQQNDTMTPFLDTLMPREHILWSGRPKPGLAIMPSQGIEYFLYAFWLIAIIIMLVWSIITVENINPVVLAFALTFVPGAVYLMIWRLSWQADGRKRTIYALTTKRALIIFYSKTGDRKLRMADIKTVRKIHLHLGKDNVGTITFGPFIKVSTQYSVYPPAFVKIDNADQVYEMICKIRQGNEVSVP